MQLSRAGSRPANVRVGALYGIAALLLALVAVSLSGCASSPATQSANLYRAQGTEPRISPLVEIEEDGLASQRPPRLRATEEIEPDDPSEPFSPSYGTVPVSEPTAS
jgi:hypothetical protein